VDAAGFDQLWFSLAVTPAQVVVTQTVSSVRLDVGDESLELGVVPMGLDTDLPIDLLVFADGSSIALADVVDMTAFRIPEEPSTPAIVGPEDFVFEFEQDSAPPETETIPATAEIHTVALEPGVEAFADFDAPVLVDAVALARAGTEAVVADDSTGAVTTQVMSPIGLAAFSRDLDESDEASADELSDVRSVSPGDVAGAIDTFVSSEEGQARSEQIVVVSAGRDGPREETVGISSWAMTNALIEWHLSRTDLEAQGSEVTRPFGPARLTAAALADAFDVASGRNTLTEAASLQPLAGLREGFAVLA
jgi:hypothetical protein